MLSTYGGELCYRGRGEMFTELRHWRSERHLKWILWNENHDRSRKY